MKPELCNALVLAYLGDAVLEVLVRDYLVLKKGIAKPNELQKNATAYVSAKAQASFMRSCKEQAWMSEEELSWYRRGRNSKGRRSVKNMDIQTHNESSGFEAVFGTLHLKNDEKRIQEIFEKYVCFIESGEENG